jgi:hypothetical protein
MCVVFYTHQDEYKKLSVTGGIVSLHPVHEGRFFRAEMW